jgi:hypothetical protein
MRARLAFVGALVALAGAPADAGAAAGCRHSLPHAPRLPAPVVLATACGVFEVGRDGSVSAGRRPDVAPGWAPRAIAHPDGRTWVAHHNRRLVVYRDGRLFWRSRITGGTDAVAVDGNRIAFTAFRRWTGMNVWLARVGERERMVGRREQLVGWTRGGLVTQQGVEVRLRGRDGRLLRTLGMARTVVRDGDEVVLLTTDDLVVRTDGWRRRVLADLVPLGMANQPWLSVLRGALLQISAGNRVVFLDRNGKRFASAAFARAGRRDGGGAIVGEPLTLPHRRAVLFVVNRRHSWTDPGVETVYRLDRGHRVPRPLFRSTLHRQTCGDWARLTYRAGRVLFAASQGGVAVLDPAGRAAPIDLTPLGRRLLPTRPNPDDRLSAYWSG